MCTAATYCNGDFYFGRNLDYEFSYGEHVTITPRNYPIRLHGGALDRHYAMIGMAHIQNDYPLYYDAVNEKGLCIAGLNFVGNAVYPPRHTGRGLGAAVRAHPVAARHVRHGRRGAQCARARGRGQHAVCARAAVRAAALAGR